MTKRSAEIRLHVMSPVHIGCGESYEPMRFKIDVNTNRLIEFDPVDFIASLSRNDREMFNWICGQGSIESILQIYRFISEREVKSGRAVDVVPDLINHYRYVLGLEKDTKRQINKFTIERTAFNANTDLPYVPGSSLKGALRTACLSRLAVDAGLRKRYPPHKLRNGKKMSQESRAIENDLLGGSFSTDPFRMVRVSDLMPAKGVKTRVVYAVNKKKNSMANARGPYRILETVKPGSAFTGVIEVVEPEKGAEIRRPLTMEGLLGWTNEFYMSLLEKECSVTEKARVKTPTPASLRERYGDGLGRTAFLVRIGRHSGAEAVTIEGCRHIKINQGKGKAALFWDHATTLWLASDYRKPRRNEDLTPFGWCVMELVQ